MAPGATTDDYDSTDHTPHPYHMMVDPRGERKFLGSRAGSRMKHGRNQRGRPFSRDQGGRQSQLAASGRRSRAVARDVQSELAWMDIPGGVQLMRIQVLNCEISSCICVPDVIFCGVLLTPISTPPPTFQTYLQIPCSNLMHLYISELDHCCLSHGSR